MEINKETFTIQALKQLLKEVFEFDYPHHKGRINFLPLTVVEWYRSDIFKEQLSLDNIRRSVLYIKRPFYFLGNYFPNKKSIVLFLHDRKVLSLLSHREKNSGEFVANYTFTLFHELRHHYKKVIDDSIGINEQVNFGMFNRDISYYISYYFPSHYGMYHDEYWHEIDANLYGINRTSEFLKSKGMLTEECKTFIRKRKNRYLYNLNSYDFHYFLSVLDKIVKNNPEIDINDNYFLALFYKNNKEFNSVDEILYLANAWNVDEKVLNYFFSNAIFLNNLDFISLSLRNQKVIVNAIDCALKKEINRRNNNNELLKREQIDLKMYLEVDERICSKIAYLNKKLEEFKRLMGLSNINETIDKLQR